MKKQANFNNLKRFFEHAHKNREICLTEVENFLHEFLKYIFDLNSLDLTKYDITISKTCLTETHSKRAHEFKKECNQENRKREKRKTLNKRGYHAYCDNDYYDAILIPSHTIENKYTIFLNEATCKARNEAEFADIVLLIQNFGHEVHHIIQYIRHVQEMKRYDNLDAINQVNLNNASYYYDPRDARKIKRLIHQHISAIYTYCKSEKYADKKGYDYLDILFNEILSTIPSSNNEHQLTETDKFRFFIEDCQELNLDLFKCRFPHYERSKKINTKVCKKLKYYGYCGDDLEID